MEQDCITVLNAEGHKIGAGRMGLCASPQAASQAGAQLVEQASRGEVFTVQGLQCFDFSRSVSSNQGVSYSLTFRCARMAAALGDRD